MDLFGLGHKVCRKFLFRIRFAPSLKRWIRVRTRTWCSSLSRTLSLEFPAHSSRVRRWTFGGSSATADDVIAYFDFQASKVKVVGTKVRRTSMNFDSADRRWFAAASVAVDIRTQCLPRTTRPSPNAGIKSYNCKSDDLQVQPKFANVKRMITSFIEYFQVLQALKFNFL